MSLASDYAALITAENATMAGVQAERPAPFVGPLVTINVLDNGNAEIMFGTNRYEAPAAACVALGTYLLTTFG
jgi:hypothetical protein